MRLLHLVLGGLGAVGLALLLGKRDGEGAGQVEPIRVRFDSHSDFIRQVSEAYRVAGASPTEIPLLVAHSALATGYGNNVWNYNVGVLKASDPYIRAGGEWVLLRGEESDSGGLVASMHRWRVYDSLVDSARDLMGVLDRPRYETARRLLRKGDPSWYFAFGQAGFYTMDVGPHYASYLGVLAEVERRVA